MNIYLARMKNYTLQLSDEYEVPAILVNASNIVWESILTNAARVVQSSRESTGELIESTIRTELEKQYDNRLSDLTRQLAEQKDEAERLRNELQDKHRETLQTLRSEYKSLLETEVKCIEDAYNARLESRSNATTTLIEELNQRLQSTRSTIEAEYKATLHEQIEQLQKDHENKLQLSSMFFKQMKEYSDSSYSTQIDTLTKQIEALTKQLDAERSASCRISSKYEELLTKQINAIREQSDKRIAELEQQLSNLAQPYIEQIARLNKLVEEEKQKLLTTSERSAKHYEKQIHRAEERLQTTEVNHKEQLQRLVEQLRTTELLYKEQIERLQSNQSSYEQINETLKPIVKFYTGTNMEKGISGESIIYNTLRTDDRYAEAIIEQTAGQTARGDIYFRWRKLRCLIEVKNKFTIEKVDLEKFTRDIKESAELNLINCGIFFSLQTDYFPNKPREPVLIEFIDAIPVIYIHVQNISDIRYSISCLEKIVITNSTTSEQTDILIRHFKNYHATLTAIKEYFQRALKTKQAELRHIVKQLDFYSNAFDTLSPDYTNLCKLLSIETQETQETQDEVQPDQGHPDEQNDEPQSTIDISQPTEALEKIKEVYCCNALQKIYPTQEELCEHFSIHVNDLNQLGGYKKIVEAVRTEYLREHFTRDIIAKLNEYYSEHKHYPKQPEMYKFISKRTIQNISHVLRVAKIKPFLEKICEAHQ